MVVIPGVTDVDMEEEEEEETEEEEEEQETEWKPPTKDEWTAFQREHKRRADQVIKLKKAAKAIPEKVEDDETAKKALEAVELKYKSRLVNAEARALLSKMGLKGEPKRLTKLLDLDDIEIDDDDEIDGLTDQLDGLKADYPDLFDNRKAKVDKHVSVDSSDKTPVSTKKDSATLLADILRGNK